MTSRNYNFFNIFNSVLTVTHLSPIHLFSILTIFSSIFHASRQTCPRFVTTEANKCLTDFSGQYRNIQISDRKLYSGLDVETLRAFCSTYVRAMTCIQNLKEECPSDVHADIDSALVNLQSAEAELNDLCRDDRLYEIYARHQTCFMKMGPQSETCSDRFLNSSVRPNIIASIEYRSIDELCKDIRNILDCIKTSIRQNCDSEAAGLVEILVKASYRRSSQCNYVEIHVENQQADAAGSATVSREDNAPETEKHQQTRHVGDGNSSPRTKFDQCLLVLFVIFIGFIGSEHLT